jgi:hypothetical protein
MRLAAELIMNTPPYRIHELRQLISSSTKLKTLRRDHPPTTIRAHHADQLFDKAVLHGLSFDRLLSQSAETLDPGALASVARCIIEAHNVFSYLCETNVSDDEFMFRVALMGYHHAVDIEKTLSQLGFDGNEGMSLAFNSIAKEATLRELEQNAIFQALPAHEKKELREGKRAYGKGLKHRGGPLPKQLESGIYRLLSSNVHSLPMGLFNGGRYNPLNIVGSVFVAMEVAIIYLASITRSYCRLRWKLGKLLTSEEKRFIRSLVTADFIKTWISVSRRPDDSLSQIGSGAQEEVPTGSEDG